VVRRVLLGWIVVLVGTGTAPSAEAAPPDPLRPQDVAFALRYGYGNASAPDKPQARDRWLAMDKAKHLGGSFLWTLSTQYALVVKAGWSRRDALPLSVASAGAAGLAKELYDRYAGPTRQFSLKDLGADAAGIALAVGVVVL